MDSIKPSSTAEETESQSSSAVLAPDTAWDTATKRTVLIVFLAFGVLIFWVSRPVLPILIMAGLVSYFLIPIVDLCERLRIPRSVSTIVLYLLFLVLLILAPVLLVPILLSQLRALYFDVPTATENFLLFLQDSVADLPTSGKILGLDITFEGVVGQIQQMFADEIAVERFLPGAQQILDYVNQLLSTATNVVSSTATIGLTVVGSIVTTVVFLLLLFFISLYITKDAPRIQRYVEGLFPVEYYSEGVELMRRLRNIWNAFFRGQLILSLSIGAATYFSLSMMGMRGALILALLAGALEILPNIGPILAMIPAVIIALAQGSSTLELSNLNFALLVIGVYFVIQQLEHQLLVPRVIGSSVHLHPVVIVCGVVVGASVGGILGAFLAAPVIASLRLIGSYTHAKLLNYQPFSDRGPVTQAQGAGIYRRVVVSDADDAAALPEVEVEEDAPAPPASQTANSPAGD
jgi:predicted PurR-regulated permease PerM